MSRTTFIWSVILILILGWSQYILTDSLKVDPPVEVLIHDPGHFGHLHIHWKPPASLQNLTECALTFQLEYFNTYKARWTKIRTSQWSFNAQFDLEKEIRVRIYTLLTGECTNGSEFLMSTCYTEVVQQPAHLGPVGTRVQDFDCVFYRREYVECTWEKGQDETVGSQRFLFYWHSELEHAEECPSYIYTNHHRSGCNFTWQSLPDFTYVNFCVNGSSTNGILRPAFLSVQIQNQIKPAQTTVGHVQTRSDREVEVLWECPPGRVPKHCLEWEVEHKQKTRTGEQLLHKRVTTQMALKYTTQNNSESDCFRVRSRLHQYCADKGFFSDWSNWFCNSENSTDHSYGLEPVVLCALVGIAIFITIVMLNLCGLALWRMLKVRGEKKLNPKHFLSAIQI